jgi:hypothetical protein
MAHVLFNLVCAAGLALLGLLLRMDAVRASESAARALRLAEEKAEEDGALAEQADLQKKVDELVAQYKHAKGTAGSAAKVKMPELVEKKRKGTVTFAELGAMPRAIKTPGTPIPEKLKELDGRTLTLTGFQLVPFADEKISEVIVAKDPWDECCLGTPPTLFTAVKVRAAPGRTFGKQSIRIASFTGTLRVRPVYESGGGQTYLTELYTLEDAVEAAGTSAAVAFEGYRSMQAYYMAALPLVVVAAVGGNLLFFRRRDEPADEHADLQFSKRKFSIEDRP